MADKQIDFAPLQKEDRRVAPFMWALSILCIVIVTIILLSELQTPDGKDLLPALGAMVPVLTVMAKNADKEGPEAERALVALRNLVRIVVDLDLAAVKAKK